MAYREKEIDVEQVVRYLNNAFNKATYRMGRAARFVVTNDWKRDADGHFTVAVPLSTPRVETSKLYTSQVNFTRMIDNLQRGPKYLIPKIISDCNRLIDDISPSK